MRASGRRTVLTAFLATGPARWRSAARGAIGAAGVVVCVIGSIAWGRTYLLHRVLILDELRIPPSNQLETLKGDRRGQHSIRINDQYRTPAASGTMLEWHRWRGTDLGGSPLQRLRHCWRPPDAVPSQASTTGRAAGSSEERAVLAECLKALVASRARPGEQAAATPKWMLSANPRVAFLSERCFTTSSYSETRRLKLECHTPHDYRQSTGLNGSE